MAKKQNVVIENVKQENPPVDNPQQELVAPPVPVKDAEKPAEESQPAESDKSTDKPKTDENPPADKSEADKSEPPKTETKKSTKKAATKKSAPKDKDKSEKDETAPEASKPKFKVKRKEIAEKLKASGLSVAELEAMVGELIAAKNGDKPKKSEASTEMFPATFTVHGVKFTKCTLKPTKGEDGNESYVKSLMLEFANAQKKDTVLAVAMHTPREFTAQKGKSRTSEYERWYGVICPEQFPFDIEMMAIDTILPFHFNGVSMHSMYTEAPSTIPLKAFNKRDKNSGAFVALNDFKFDIYCVDFSEKDDCVHGDFIDILGVLSSDK